MIDAHLHLQDCLASVERGQLIDQLRRLGVEHLMVNATSPEDWEAVEQLACAYEEVIPSYGIHPWKVDEAVPGWEERLSRLLHDDPRACVGEVGLDRWIRNHDLPQQRRVFLSQLDLAHRFDRPVTVHCLQAWGSLLECLRESDFRGSFLLHSYGGPVEMVPEFLEMGAYFSVSGYFFRPEKAAKLEVFASVPRDRILLETDAPDMAFSEDQARYAAEGLDNHPANIELVYESFAEWSGLSLEELRKQCGGNFRAFFGHDDFRSKQPETA